MECLWGFQKIKKEIFDLVMVTGFGATMEKPLPILQVNKRKTNGCFTE